MTIMTTIIFKAFVVALTFASIINAQLQLLPSVTLPASNTVWKAGSQVTVSWSGLSLGIVEITLLSGNLNVVQIIATTIPASSNSYTFTLPATISSGSNYCISVAALPSIVYSALFTIVNEVLSPTTQVVSTPPSTPIPQSIATVTVIPTIPTITPTITPIITPIIPSLGITTPASASTSTDPAPPGITIPATIVSGNTIPATVVPGTIISGTFIPGTVVSGTFIPGTGTVVSGAHASNLGLTVVSTNGVFMTFAVSIQRDGTWPTPTGTGDPTPSPGSSTPIPAWELAVIFAVGVAALILVVAVFLMTRPKNLRDSFRDSLTTLVDSPESGLQSGSVILTDEPKKPARVVLLNRSSSNLEKHALANQPQSLRLFEPDGEFQPNDPWTQNESESQNQNSFEPRNRNSSDRSFLGPITPSRSSFTPSVRVPPSPSQGSFAQSLRAPASPSRASFIAPSVRPSPSRSSFLTVPNSDDTITVVIRRDDNPAEVMSRLSAYLQHPNQEQQHASEDATMQHPCYDPRESPRNSGESTALRNGDAEC